MSNQKSLEERVAQLEQELMIVAKTLIVQNRNTEGLLKALTQHEDVILQSAECIHNNADASVALKAHVRTLEEAVIQMQRAVKQVQIEVFPSAKEQYETLEAAEPSSDPEPGAGGMWN